MNVAKLTIRFDEGVKDHERCMRHIPKMVADFCAERKYTDARNVSIRFQRDDFAIVCSNGADRMPFVWW